MQGWCQMTANIMWLGAITFVYQFLYYIIERRALLSQNFAQVF